MSIRVRRRNRWRERIRLNKLDAIASEKLKHNYVASQSSWGGTRCPDCGYNVRPHWVAPTVTVFSTFRVHEQEMPCQKIKRCPGRQEWD